MASAVVAIATGSIFNPLPLVSNVSRSESVWSVDSRDCAELLRALKDVDVEVEG
jgi:hypothetical protein